MENKTNKGNIFFYLAIFSILLAGDLVWWQGQQTLDTIDQTASIVQPVYRRVKKVEEARIDVDKEIASLDQDLKDMDSGNTKDIQQLQKEDTAQ